MGQGEDEEVLWAKELAVQRLEGKKAQANLENKLFNMQEQSDWWYEKIDNLRLQQWGVTYSDFHVKNLAAR